MAGVSESDAAFYSFSCVMLSLYIAPAALFTLYRFVRTPKRTRSAAFAVHIAMLVLALALFYQCLQQLQSVDTSGVFDPYEILKISERASLREIKKAYRTLGRELHPDKNLDNPRAAAQFTRVTKAYEALTDREGIENFKKYGHPDGRQSSFMEFAFLSAFSDSGSGSSSLFVLGYFGIVFGGIAWIVYTLHKSSGVRDRTQISKKTTALLIDALQDKMSVHDIVELLLSTDEMTTYQGGEEDKIQALQRAPAHNKLIKKMEAAKVLPSEILGRIKKHPNHVARENMLALYQFLRRNKLHGVPKPTWLDPRLHKVLLELPFLVEIFAKLVVEHSIKRGFTALTLLRALSLLSSLAQGSFVADADALRDQKARLAPDAKLPDLAIDAASLTVLDEPNIQPGDWITAQMTIVRKHMSPGESAPLASTFYDEIDASSPFRKEHLWVVLMEKTTSRLFAAWKCVDLSQTVAQKVGFTGPGVAGKYDVEIRVLTVANLAAQASVSVPLHVENAAK
uniref:J domain-containing protein n=1 Tax=Globisporangium ultimum (strain ATCC 200006 / CBS 805.95 / DAOM BR144) TaxID=431595 RepID=K3W4Z7_GLOUD